MIFTSDDIQVHDDGITVEEQNLIAVQFNAAMWRLGAMPISPGPVGIYL